MERDTSGEDFLARSADYDPVKMYLNEIGQIALLTHEQEVALSTTYQEGQQAQAAKFYYNAIRGVFGAEPVKVPEIEAKIQAGAEAKRQFIEANYRLVVHIAKRYSGRGLPLLDMIQDGNIGLMRAVERFDSSKGFKFSTYATWWIRQAVTRGIHEDSLTIRLPVHVREAQDKVRRRQKILYQTLGREPTLAELEEDTDISGERIQELLGLANANVSFSSPVGEDQDTELGDLLEDPAGLTPEEILIEATKRDRLNSLMNSANLTDKERKILELRYRLGDNMEDSQTLQEVGNIYGFTRERARQIERRAIDKLRRAVRKAGDWEEVIDPSLDKSPEI